MGTASAAWRFLLDLCQNVGMTPTQICMMSHVVPHLGIIGMLTAYWEST